MQKFLLVMLGGAFGTGLRHSLSTLVYSIARQPKFPFATFIVNISGSFLIGMLAEMFDQHAARPRSRVGGHTIRADDLNRAGRVCGIAFERAFRPFEDYG